MTADDASFVALQNVIEQCCNYFLWHDRFPATYEELQPIPLLRTGVLSSAGDDGGDDGGEKGQAYRLALNREAGIAQFRFHCPEPDGAWGWRSDETIIPLPERLLARLQTGADVLAPTLREVAAASGGRYAVLDLAHAVSPAQPLPAWGAVARVLGVDWGVRTLTPGLPPPRWRSAKERASTARWAVPSSSTLAALMDARRAPAARLTSSRKK
jgi:putative transposase